MGKIGLLICLIVSLIFMVYLPYAMWKDFPWSRYPWVDGFKSTSGKVISHSIEEKQTFSEKGANKFSTPRIGYEYSLNGKRFLGNEVYFGGVRFASEENAAAALQKYPIGRVVTVYYSEKDPSLALLEASFPFMNIWRSLFYFFMGAAALVLAIRNSYF